MDPLIAEYSAAAKDYDKKWSFYVNATTAETLSRISVRRKDHVLDVGCGTGELLVRIAAKHPGAKLAGIDPVPAMLEVARSKLPAHIDLRVGWANELPWPDGTFDLVVSCNMFHYITHPVDAVREMERVLRPGGRIVITDWCDDYLACRLCNLYLRLTRKAHYKTYRQAECSALLARAGYPDPQIERYKISWLWGLMTATAEKPPLLEVP